jgi:hypothetical protein
MSDSRNERPSRPGKAVHSYCKWCINGSAQDVRLCVSTRCSLWPGRSGRKPSPEDMGEVSALRIYPEEAEALGNDWRILKAIARRCLDCAGGSRSRVRNCHQVDCDLHHLRLGRNPNRVASPKQREIKAARLKANVERSRRDLK